MEQEKQGTAEAETPEQLMDCRLGDLEIMATHDKERELLASERVICEAQLNSPKLALYIKKQICDWIAAHQMGVTIGQDMMEVAGNEIPDDASYIRVRYLDFLELKKEE